MFFLDSGAYIVIFAEIFKLYGRKLTGKTDGLRPVTKTKKDLYPEQRVLTQGVID